MKKKNVVKSKSPKCGSCQEEAKFFHSKCCNAHFDGIVEKDRTLSLACEICGKHFARVMLGK